MNLRCLTLASALTSASLLAADHVNLTGRILDPAGHPIDHATVLVYHAGVKKGYSTFCPSCYIDCGKRTTTGPDGTFVIKGVNSDLLFELLTARDGFQSTFIKAVDPLTRSAVSAVLVPRVATNGKVVRGQVVDEQGRPLRDSVVQPVGLSSNEQPSGNEPAREISRYGVIEALDPIAITDAGGNFEIGSQQPFLAMLLKFETRGFAPKLQVLPAGPDRKTVVVSPGAVVRGRLVYHGTPVAGAEIGLIPRNGGGFGGKLKIMGDPFEEIRVGTQADGSFVLADVPSPIGWYVYPKMQSLSKSLAGQPVECDTKHASQILDIGDIQLEQGHHLKGRIVLLDGAAIPAGMRVIISAKRVWDSQVVALLPDGTFECKGLPAGTYDISPGVQGYQLAGKAQSIQLNNDIEHLTIELERMARQ